MAGHARTASRACRRRINCNSLTRRAILPDVTRGHPRATTYVVIAVAAAAVLLASARPAVADGGRVAYSIAIDGPIHPRPKNELRRAIQDARAMRAALLIVRLNTPGGSATDTRQMVTSMLAAPMPVIVYVHPSGARADSAGLLLALGADVAAMAPATNIGSATPVRVGPAPRSADEARMLETLDRKFMNSSVAFARSLAEEHGRDADVAERMIRKADNVSANSALRARLVDVVAHDERALLARLDGFSVKGRKAQRLRTSGLQIRAGELSATELADDLPGGGGSFWRSLLLVGGGALTLVLVVVGTSRGRRYRRRRQRRQRVLERERERGPTA